MLAHYGHGRADTPSGRGELAHKASYALPDVYMSISDVTPARYCLAMSEPPEVEPNEAQALELLQFADSIDDEPYERDQMLARAQVYASLAIASAPREVADATLQVGGETARSMPSTSGIPELLAEISQAISQNR
jgi:hypothetical protein